MQIFRLVVAGTVDRVLGFDSLPESILTGVRRGPASGFPRHWREFLGVKHGDTKAEPFFILDYSSRNADKEKWQEISSYVKRNVDPSVRLLDKLEAMAEPLAQDTQSDLTLEPEEVPMIPLPVREPALVGGGSEAEAEPAPKRRGRKPKSEQAG
jgi:hypothetical protein